LSYIGDQKQTSSIYNRNAEVYMGGNERGMDRAVYLIDFVEFLSTKATGLQDRAEMDVVVRIVRSR
jgi:hypothetical protein